MSTLPPEVESVLTEFVPRFAVDEERGTFYPRDTLRAHLLTQAEEIERLTERARNVERILLSDDYSIEGIANIEANRDRYKAALEWVLGEGDDFPLRQEGQGAYWWRTELRRRLKAAEEATR